MSSNFGLPIFPYLRYGQPRPTVTGMTPITKGEVSKFRATRAGDLRKKEGETLL